MGVGLPLRVKVLLLFLAWLVAELALLTVLVKAVGWLAVFLLGMSTTLLGVSQMRRLGRRAFDRLRDGVQGGEPALGEIVGGSVRALGALLLIMPGFLTDVAGALLFLPAIQRVAQRLFGATRPARTGTIDLDETEWRRTESDRQGRITPPRSAG